MSIGVNPFFLFTVGKISTIIYFKNRGEIMSFQENLKKYREQAGYKTAKEFAQTLSVSYDAYVGYENKGREPKYSVLVEIAQKLGVSTDDLLDSGNILVADRDKALAFNLQKLRSIGFSIRKTEGSIILSLSSNQWKFSKERFMELMQEVESSEKYKSDLSSIYSLKFEQAILSEKMSYFDFMAKMLKDNPEEYEKTKSKLLKAILRGMGSTEPVEPKEPLTLEKLIYDTLKKQNKL